MADFLVGLWTIPHAQNWKRAWKVRALDMRKSLERLNGMLRVHAGSLDADGAFQAIFLAPEYYFTEQSPKGRRLPLNDRDRRNLEDTLLGFSNEFSKILIVPGSAFYEKPMERGTDPREQLKFNPATGKRDLPKVQAPDHRRQHVLKQVDTAIAVAAAGPRQGVITKWSVLALDGKGGADYKYWDPADQIYAMIPPLALVRSNIAKEKPRIARNATYALLGGRRLAKYDKHGDFFEADGKPDEMVFIPGTKNQCPEIGGFKFGFEICFDHANATLMKRGVPGLAFHLLVSDYVMTQKGNMAMDDNGYFLHASTSYAQTSVYHRNEKGALENFTGDVKYRITHDGQAGEWLDFYKLPLPA